VDRDSSLSDPSLILDHLEAFRRSRAMFAAVALGVFDALAGGPRALDGLAGELKVDRDALERLLDPCVGLQLLHARRRATRMCPPPPLT
jgi:hypothetical protein